MGSSNRIPSLVAYCEDLLIHQIDIQSVIPLYQQAYSMGFHRISVFLSFVICENIQHLLHFLLRDCTEEQVGFIEQLYKSKYYPETNVNFINYYGDAQYFAQKRRVIEQFRILPQLYPNYKTELSRINQQLAKIKIINDKIQQMMPECEEQLEEQRILKQNEEIIYFDSDEESSDKELSLETSALSLALSHLSAKEHSLYKSKQCLDDKRNLLLIKIANP